MSTSFECAILKGINKVGNIKKLDGGYVELVMGALEYPNSVGAVYDQTRAATFFQKSSAFMRRVTQGYLRGELGHPPQRDCKNYDDYVERIHTILESNVAIHIRKVWLDYNYVMPDGRKVIAIMGEVCGSGPHAGVFDRMLMNPHENLALSIRSMATDKFVAGKKRKYLDNIITWDLVNEPGISAATKYNSPSCESHVVERVPVNEALIESFLLRQENRGVALESSMASTVEAMQAMRKNRVQSRGNNASRWAR